MSAKKETIAEHISAAIESGKYILNLEEARKIMEMSGIPFNKSGFATTEEDTEDEQEVSNGNGRRR